MSKTKWAFVLAFLSLCILVIVGSLFRWSVPGGLRCWYFWNYEFVNNYGMHQRATGKRLELIGLSLLDYQESFGRYPMTQAEWESVDPEVPALLTALESCLDSFVVSYELLHADHVAVVVITPDNNHECWQANPRKASYTHVAFFNDGTFDRIQSDETEYEEYMASIVR